MRLLLRLVGRRLFNLAFRWLVLGVLSRFASRWLRRTSAARARIELDAAARDRVPAPLGRALAALPESAKAAGGSALVAGRISRSVVAGTRRARRFARRPRGTGHSGAQAMLDQLASETESSTRELRSRYLAATDGPDAATNALLDVRHAPEVVDPASPTEPPDPYEAVPAPVRPGRRRVRRRRAAPVNRISRTYHRPRRPWD